MNIVYSCDENFLEYFYISASSVLLHNNNVSLFLLFHGDKNSQLLNQIERELKQKLTVIFPDVSTLENVKVSKSIPVAAYLRLLIPKYLSDLKRILYIDCDTIICDSLHDLWNIDLNGNTLAAISEESIYQVIKEKLGLDDYFNSGVLLIDVEKFASYYQAFLEFLPNHNRITFHDQCVLNYILRDNWLSIDRKWNYMSHNFKEGEKLSLNFKILHYNSLYGKPWETGCTHPFKHHYEFIKSRTIFAGSAKKKGRITVRLRNKYKFIDKLLRKIRGYV